MMTRAEYIESLRRLNLKVYFMGELIENRPPDDSSFYEFCSQNL